MLVGGRAVQANVFLHDIAVRGEGHAVVEDIVAGTFISYQSIGWRLFLLINAINA